MRGLPKKLEQILKENEALIKKVLGDSFYNRIAIGDITYLDLRKIEEILRIRAAALKK